MKTRPAFLSSLGALALAATVANAGPVAQPGGTSVVAYRPRNKLRRVWHLERILTLRSECGLCYIGRSEHARAVFIEAAGPDARRRGS